MVRISRSLLERIMADMASEPHRERCGLLLGCAGSIEDWLSAANVHVDPTRHFELDPAVLLAAMRAPRAGGMAVAGHVHSHPGSDSAPSPADACAADDDGRLWLIIGRDGPRLWRSVANGSHLGAFEPMPLSIIGEA
jgi:desampylase